MTLLLFLFTIKHCIADVFLQTYHSSEGVYKERYLGWGGHRHYIEHGVCTVILLLFFTSPTMAILLGLLDYAVHWHVDWGKTTIYKKLGYKRSEPRFWRLHTLDQILHFSTYGAIVWIISMSL